MCLNQLNDKLGVCALNIYRVWKRESDAGPNSAGFAN